MTRNCKPLVEIAINKCLIFLKGKGFFVRHAKREIKNGLSFVSTAAGKNPVNIDNGCIETHCFVMHQNVNIPNQPLSGLKMLRFIFPDTDSRPLKISSMKCALFQRNIGITHKMSK
jgi:hypothetical protein